MTSKENLKALSLDSDYDPNSMPVDQARKYIANFLEPVTSSEKVSIRDSLGRVLSENVISPVNVPQHDNSAMDGYAMKGIDLIEGEKSKLAVIGTAFAGQPFQGHVESGQAVRIMTGAVIPDGADTVVMQERAERDGDSVLVDYFPAGANTRKAGEDLKLGAPALTKGTRSDQLIWA